MIYSIHSYDRKKDLLVRVLVDPQNRIVYSHSEEELPPRFLQNGHLEIARIGREVEATSLMQWLMKHESDIEDVMDGFLGYRADADGNQRGAWTDRALVTAGELAREVSRDVNYGSLVRHMKASVWLGYDKQAATAAAVGDGDLVRAAAAEVANADLQGILLDHEDVHKTLCEMMGSPSGEHLVRALEAAVVYGAGSNWHHPRAEAARAAVAAIGAVWDFTTWENALEAAVGGFLGGINLEALSLEALRLDYLAADQEEPTAGESKESK